VPATEDTQAFQRIIHPPPQYYGVVWAGRIRNDQFLYCREVLVVQCANALDRRRERLRLLRLVGSRRQLWRQI
jgi:hypothetical protein